MIVSRLKVFDSRGKVIVPSQRDKDLAKFYYDQQSKKWPALGRERRLKTSIFTALFRIDTATDYAVARISKANGFDTKVLRQIIRLRKQDPGERQEQETLRDLYMHALGMLPESGGEL